MLYQICWKQTPGEKSLNLIKPFPYEVHNLFFRNFRKEIEIRPLFFTEVPDASALRILSGILNGLADLILYDKGTVNIPLASPSGKRR